MDPIVKSTDTDKEKERARKAKYYQENKERILANNAAWKLKNKQRYDSQQLVYRQENRDFLNAQSREWRIQNPEKAKAAIARWKENNLAYYEAQQAASYMAHRQERLASRKAYKAKNAEVVLAQRLEKYRLSPAAFQKMVTEQHGVCKICGGPPIGGHKRLSVDHDHSTGRVRGLLCGNCNAALGLLQEKTEILQKAIAYLKEGSQ